MEKFRRKWTERKGQQPVRLRSVHEDDLSPYATTRLDVPTEAPLSAQHSARIVKLWHGRSRTVVFIRTAFGRSRVSGRIVEA
jgi:hypothetical protein